MGLRQVDESVRAAAWSPDGRHLAIASADHSLRLWDGAQASLIALRTGDVTAVAWSPDGSRLACAEDDGTVRLFDTAGPAVAPAPSLAHGGAVNDLTFSPDGTRLATAGVDGTVRVWDVAAAGAVAAVAAGGRCLAVDWARDAGGRDVLAVATVTGLVVFDVAPTATPDADLAAR